jgi:hypothetical protein
MQATGSGKAEGHADKDKEQEFGNTSAPDI